MPLTLLSSLLNTKGRVNTADAGSDFQAHRVSVDETSKEPGEPRGPGHCSRECRTLKEPKTSKRGNTKHREMCRTGTLHHTRKRRKTFNTKILKQYIQEETEIRLLSPAL